MITREGTVSKLVRRKMKEQRALFHTPLDVLYLEGDDYQLAARIESPDVLACLTAIRDLMREYRSATPDEDECFSTAVIYGAEEDTRAERMFVHCTRMRAVLCRLYRTLLLRNLPAHAHRLGTLEVEEAQADLCVA